MIVGIYEDRNGTRFVEIHKDDNTFSLKFPQDEEARSLPFERLEQLKTALEDVVWNKGRSTAIPDVNS